MMLDFIGVEAYLRVAEGVERILIDPEAFALPLEVGTVISHFVMF